jgi:hypothetical protein
MMEKLFSWLPTPIFSSGVMPLRSDSRIRRQIIIGRSSAGEDVSCYRVDEEFGRQEKTYLLGSSDPESLSLTYEKALLQAEDEGYVLKDPDRPKPDEVEKALLDYARNS